MNRLELLALLEEGLERQITVVSAPAGFGKTTSVAAWLVQRSATPALMPVAWYTADRFDSELRIFCAYLLGALRTVHPEVGNHTWQTLHSPQLPLPEELADLLIEELATLKEDTILVIDDYQEVKEPTVHLFFSRLLHRLPTNLRLVLLTRNHPPFSIARLRLQHRLTFLNAEQLRFNLSETKELFASSLEQKIDDDLAASIYHSVEGWGAALVLFIAALRDGAPIFTAQQSMDTITHQGANYLLDYLTAEVLASQTDEIEEFLLRTSMLGIFNADLCAAVYPGCTPERAHTLLLQLEQANLLILSADTAYGWYRYHSLLKVVLQQRMRRALSPCEVRSCYCRAAEWMAAEGDIEQALNYYLATDAIEEAADLLEISLPDLQNREQWLALDRWLQRLPATVIEARPALLLAQAWILNFRFQFQKMQALITSAEALLADGKGPTDPERNRVLRGQIEAFHTSAHLTHCKSQERVVHGRKALALLPANHSFARGFTLQHMAGAYQSMGGWQEAVQLLRDALYVADPQTTPYNVRLLHGLSVTYAYAGQLHSAEQSAQSYCYYATEAELPTSMAWAGAFLGTLAYQQNKTSEAMRHHKRVVEMHHTAPHVALVISLQDLILMADTESEQSWLQQALDHLRKDLLQAGNHEALPSVDALNALLWLRQGDPVQVRSWTQTANPGKGLHGTIPVVEMTYIRAMLAEGTESALKKAQQCAGSLVAICRKRHIYWHLFDALLCQALIADASGDIEQAFDTLAEVIECAIPLGFRRIFLQDDPLVQTLLSQFVQAANKPTAPAAWLAAAQVYLQSDLLPVRAGDGAKSDASDNSWHPSLFSERELEILYLLAQSLSNKEIAYRLHISPHTVRNHLVKIFDKLGVNSRVEVILRAREIGLLPLS